MTEIHPTIRSIQCRNELKAIREEYGYSIFDQAFRELCNRKKGGKSIQEQSKSSGRPFVDIVRVPIDEDTEHIEDAEVQPQFLRKRMD